MLSKIFKLIFGEAQTPTKSIEDQTLESEPAPFDSGESISLYEPPPNDRYPDNWDDLRKQALRRDNGHCQVTGCVNCCAVPGDPESQSYGDLRLCAHHIQPLSEGGLNNLENLVTLCEFHHGLLHFDNQELKEEIPSLRFSLIKPYWRRNRWSAERHHVRAAVRRFKLGTKEEFRRMREYYIPVCRVCKSKKWESDFTYEWRGLTKHRLVETRCLDCNDRWLFERGLIEETGFQIASSFEVKKNQGTFFFNPNLIVGLDLPKHFEGCPKCLGGGRPGYLIRKEGLRGPFLGCSEWDRGKGCDYTRKI